jgi:hypothetical protein
MQKKNLSRAAGPAQVSVDIGFKSTRNFQSVNVNIGITDFVRSEENTDQAVERVYKYVEHKVMQKLEQAKRDLADLDGK